MTKNNTQPLVVIFHKLGPYHIARLNGAAVFGPVVCIELSKNSDVYSWKNHDEVQKFERITLYDDDDSRSVGFKELSQKIEEQLSKLNPKAVAINGWWDNGARAALDISINKKIPTILMSETQFDDGKRTVITEWVKSNIVAQFDTAVIGGVSHQKYLTQLGTAKNRIFKGYDVVDNNYFTDQANQFKKEAKELRQELGLSRSFFLASNRFIEKKNLHMLIECYGDYRLAVNDPWDLVLLGDGELRRSLEIQAKFAKLSNNIHFPGFQQIDDLPKYYALANAFVHISTHEQWGLVINEAMASKLPVLVSKKCGATREMIKHGKNGLVVNPFDRREIVEALISLHTNKAERNQFAENGFQTIQKYAPETFGENIWKAAEMASSKYTSKPKIGKLILSSINRWKQLPTRRIT